MAISIMTSSGGGGWNPRRMSPRSKQVAIFAAAACVAVLFISLPQRSEQQLIAPPAKARAKNVKSTIMIDNKPAPAEAFNHGARQMKAEETAKERVVVAEEKPPKPLDKDEEAAVQRFVEDRTLVHEGNPPTEDCSPLFPSVIVYNRIPKAASSTIITLLREMAEENGFVISRPTPKHDQDAARQAILGALESGEKTVIVQHFHFPDVVDDRIAYINVMRHPVDRCVSAYHYLRYGARPKADRERTIRRLGDLSMEECLSQPIEEWRSCLNCPPQVQARFFCGPDGGMCDRPHPEEIVRRAWYNLKSQYTVGVMENLTSTIDVWESLFPKFFRGMGEALGRSTPQRVSSKKSSYVEPNEKTRQSIARWSAVDMEIYDKAAADLEKLHKVCMDRRAAKLERRRQRNEE